MKKIIALTLVTASLLFSLSAVSVSAHFGTGAEAIADNVQIVKSALIGRKYVFSDADFKQGLCITSFDGIKITELPKSSDGALMLAGRRVSAGATVKRKNISALVFIPTSKETSEATFKFALVGDGSGSEIEFIIRFTDRVNYEPEISEDALVSLSLKTQKEIAIHGKMQAVDKEGDAIEYMIVSYPKCGRLTSINKESGEYVYTPNDSFVGKDSFVYVARDEWGNFSETQKVDITVSKRMSDIVYVDMQNRAEYNAAVAMTAMGIMNGRVVGDGVYFNPDETVTRAEFVSMALKTMGIKADGTKAETYFDDNAEIPTALLPYIVSAQKMGILRANFKDGKLLFRPNDEITKYEAASIMAELMNISEFTGEDVMESENLIPVWARQSVYAMSSVGIFDYSEDASVMTGTVTRAECAEYLYRMINN